MKIEIVYTDRERRKRTVEFTGDRAVEEGFKFIFFNQPIHIIAIRST
jgi:hypothetical protein